jgi:hypothetical protein
MAAKTRDKKPSIGHALFMGILTILLAVVLFYFFRSI